MDLVAKMNAYVSSKSNRKRAIVRYNGCSLKIVINFLLDLPCFGGIVILRIISLHDERTGGLMNDHTLVKLIKTKPNIGLSELLDRYAALIYSIVSARALGTATCEDIEECVSSVIFEIYKNVEKIDLKRGGFKAYVSVAARRSAIDLFWKSQKNRKKVIPIDDYAGDLVEDSLTEDIVLEAEEKRQLIKAIFELGEPDSQILFRKYFYGQKSKEIAKDIGLTSAAVDMRAFRSLKKLRDKMGGTKQ